MTIGLLGGTFNPPHEGHILLSESARKALSLDFVWWLITPQNPLKKKTGLLPITKRLELAQQITNKHPLIIPSCIENKLKTRYTIDTVRALKKKFPHTRFVWICGSDVVAQFSRWKQWQKLLHEIPFVCLARPPHPSVIRGNALRSYMGKHMRTDEKGGLSLQKAPNWLWLLGTRTSTQSSTKLRKNKGLEAKTTTSCSAVLKNTPKKR